MVKSKEKLCVCSSSRWHFSQGHNRTGGLCVFVLTIKGKQIEITYQTAVITVTFERAHWIKNHKIIPRKSFLDFFPFDSSNFSLTGFFQSQKQLHKLSISLHNNPKQAKQIFKKKKKKSILFPLKKSATFQTLDWLHTSWCPHQYIKRECRRTPKYLLPITCSQTDFPPSTSP